MQRRFLTLATLMALALLSAGCADEPAGNGGEQASGEQGAESRPPEPPPSAIDRIDAFIAAQSVDKSRQGWRTSLKQPPEAAFEAGREYRWRLDTSVGPIVVKFFPDVAPMHVTSTIYLTRLGFYDGLKFHRVIPGFMAQGGCPLGTGTGGPGYGYGGEFRADVRHDRPGLLSMANTGRPNSDGSQFFLTFVPTPHLDNKHTVFGEVVEGMDNLKAIEGRAGGGQAPVEIVRATIEAK